jgi:hypothetical protein
LDIVEAKAFSICQLLIKFEDLLQHKVAELQNPMSRAEEN